MRSDTAWSIPCCAAVSASISVERPLSVVVAALCEPGVDNAEARSEESGQKTDINSAFKHTV